MTWHIDRHPDIRQDVPHDPNQVADLIADVEAYDQAERDRLRARMTAERGER